MNRLDLYGTVSNSLVSDAVDGFLYVFLDTYSKGHLKISK